MFKHFAPLWFRLAPVAGGLLVVHSLLGVTSCSGNSKENARGKTQKSSAIVTEGDAAAGDEIAMEEGTLGVSSSVEIFGETVHPLLASHCGSCHGAAVQPKFAVADVSSAHRAIIDNSKVDLATPEHSRIVERLGTDSHGCWSACSQNAAEMLAAVKKWAESKSTNTSVAASLQTVEVSVASRKATYPDLGNTTMVIEAEPTGNPSPVVLKAPTVVANNPDGSAGKVVQFNRGGASNTVALTEAQAAATGGTLTATFTLAEAGKYRVLARVQSVAPTDDELYLRIDNGSGGAVAPIRIWKIPQTGPTSWFWASATNGANLSTLSEFDLAAGAHRVVVLQREFGAKIDRLAITKDPLFRSPDPVEILTFDLAPLLGGADVKLEVIVEDFSTEVSKIRSPRIITASKSVKVKNMFILVNGKKDNSNSTFSVVDTVVTAPGGIISNASTTVVKDKGTAEDKLSFAFEILE